MVYCYTVLVLLVDTVLEMGVREEMDNVDGYDCFGFFAFCSSVGRVVVYRTSIQLCFMILPWFGHL